MFPEANGDIGSERFDPAYFLLEHHHATTFDDLKVRLRELTWTLYLSLARLDWSP